MFTPVQMTRAESIIEREPCLRYLLSEKSWYKTLRRIPGCGRRIAVAVIAIAVRDGVIAPDDPELTRHLSKDDLADVFEFTRKPYLESTGLKFRYRELGFKEGEAEGELLTTPELAERLSIHDYSLNYHRRFKAGPPFVKGSKFVHYRLADVKTWLAQRGSIRSFDGSAK